MAETTAPTFGHALRILCASLMASLIVILVAVATTLGSDGTGRPPVWAIGVLVAVAVLEATLIPAVGFRFTPVAPGTAEDEARRDAVGQLQSTTILRFALAEAIAFVSIALAFVVDEGGLYLCALGVVVGEVLMATYVWPSDRIVSRAQESLESAGGRSYLREALDSPAPPRS